MKEKDYITVTNRVKVSIVKDVLRDVLPDDNIILTNEWRDIIIKISDWEVKLMNQNLLIQNNLSPQ